MDGRQQIAQHRSRIDAVFSRAKQLEYTADPETRADFAKHLCVLVSGYLERAVAEMLMEHSRKNGAPSLQLFVESNTRNFTNANCEKLKKLLGNFSPDWRTRLERVLVDEVKDAVDSLVANRHIIAHGGSVGITYIRVLSYYKHVQVVVNLICNICDPS